jgi:hypothetical protein
MRNYFVVFFVLVISEIVLGSSSSSVSVGSCPDMWPCSNSWFGQLVLLGFFGAILMFGIHATPRPGYVLFNVSHTVQALK